MYQNPRFKIQILIVFFLFSERERESVRLSEQVERTRFDGSTMTEEAEVFVDEGGGGGRDKTISYFLTTTEEL